MRITVIGAGAAGLSTAIILQRLYGADVRILERAAEGVMPGLGVALLQFALNDLRMISLGGFLTYEDRFRLIDRVTHVFAGPTKSGGLVRASRIQDADYWGVKRSTLLTFLNEAAQKAGIGIEYGCAISEDRVRQEREAADLLVGADGAGSVVRSAYAQEFGPKGGEAKSRYAWLELDGPLDHFIFGYIQVPGKGLMRVSAYPHGKHESSAIVTHSMGLTKDFDDAAMVDSDGTISAAGMQSINDIFSTGLGGRRLSGKSRWRKFRATHCGRAAFGNVVLVGDAYATLHYETGWGTSAALQESRVLGQILGRALKAGNTVPEGLAMYSAKSTEIAKGLVMATARAMREIDAQSTKFSRLGAAKFLEQRTP